MHSRRRTEPTLPRALAALALAVAPACSDAGPVPPEGAACQPAAPGPPSVSGVSFRADVMPLFAASCALARYCHADPAVSQGGLYLGPNPADDAYPPDDATFAAVHAALVGAPSTRAVDTPRVKPGAPEESFLIHKIYGDQNCAGILCEDPIAGTRSTDSCGDKMPPNNAVLLPAAQADLIRAWILEGAAPD